MNSIPLETLSKLLMLTERRIQQLAKEGVIPRAEHGKYALVGSIQGYIKYLKERVVGGEANPDDLFTQKIRIARSKADLSELEAQKVKGELLKLEEVQAAWIGMVANMRARLLAIPTKAAPIVRTIDSDAEAQALLKSFICEALQELHTTEIAIEAETEGLTESREAN